jgi:hypothetical protein
VDDLEKDTNNIHKQQDVSTLDKRKYTHKKGIEGYFLRQNNVKNFETFL